MLSVNYNPSVLKAQNNLTNAASAMTKALERMSTGFKINSAKDDAAGMFVATKLTTQIRGLLQARNNANDGISYISTASESLTGMGKILNRIRDLAVQGANGVYNTSSRDAMQSEADELTKELYRIKNSTIFNGQSIFGEAETSGISAISTLSAPPQSSKAVSTAGLAKVASVDEVPAGYTAIYTAEDLDNVRNNLSGKYILMNDIDLSEYANWDPIGDYGSMGDPDTYFSGVFDGNGHEIKNLKQTINSSNYTGGLFGLADGAVFKNLGLKNTNISGSSMSNGFGTLGGILNNCIVDSCYSTGNVQLGLSDNSVGGLIGSIDASTITNCHSSAIVSGGTNVGGLVGGIGSNTIIKDSYATGNINMFMNRGGGLIGYCEGTIENSYATGNISSSYARGSSIGGLAGYLDGIIKNSYATGSITLRDPTKSSNIGGLVGKNDAPANVMNSFWNTETSGLADSAGGIGLTTAEINDPKTFENAGWDKNVWDMSTAPPKHGKTPSVDPSVNDGNLRLQIGADGDESSVIHADTAFEIGAFAVDFSNEKASRASIDTVDELLEKINKKVSEFGAVLNRLDSVLTSQTTSIENLTAARSTIQDADIAEESAIFVRNQILQRTTSSLLVQAQRSQSSIINLLIQS